MCKTAWGYWGNVDRKHLFQNIVKVRKALILSRSSFVCNFCHVLCGPLSYYLVDTEDIDSEDATHNGESLCGTCVLCAWSLAQKMVGLVQQLKEFMLLTGDILSRDISSNITPMTFADDVRYVYTPR